MKAKRLFFALAISLLGSAISANAERIFADIQPSQQNDSIQTVNIYAEGDDIEGINDQLKSIEGLKTSSFGSLGEMSSIEVIYSNEDTRIADLTKRLDTGIKSLELTQLVCTDDDGDHIEIYAEPSDDPTSEQLKRMVVFVSSEHEVTCVILEGSIRALQ